MEDQGRKNQSFWLAWSHCIRGKQLRKLFDYFPDGQTAWECPSSELNKFGFSSEAISKISTERQKLDPDALMEKTEEANVKILLLSDKKYPPLLKEIYDAPVVLYYRGSLPQKDEQPLAVVGTRAVSTYGRSVTETLVRELARSGLTIVSGLARGIDGLAHNATVSVGGRTVAILGSSISANDIYPREHTRLADQIANSNGLVMSEYPPDVGPEKYHFPERNRIIAGYSLGTLVIEAPTTSGALITARLALDYNREVMATPGPVTSKTSAGTNELLKQGARPITEATDIFEALQLQKVTAITPVIDETQNPTEKQLLTLLTKEPQHIDNLLSKSSLKLTELGSTLTLLELNGLAKDVGGKNYIRL